LFIWKQNILFGSYSVLVLDVLVIVVPGKHLLHFALKNNRCILFTALESANMQALRGVHLPKDQDADSLLSVAPISS